MREFDLTNQTPANELDDDELLIEIKLAQAHLNYLMNKLINERQDYV